jgi:hypothetical protein
LRQKANEYPKQYTLEYSAKEKRQGVKKSNTEAIEGTARALEGIDDIESGDRLSLSVFSVCHRVPDNLRGRK